MQWLALLSHVREVLGFNPRPELLLSNLHVLIWPLCVFSGFSSFLQQFKDTHTRLIDDSELPKGVNVSVRLFVSIHYDSPIINWWPVQGVLDPRPTVGQLGLAPALLLWISGIASYLGGWIPMHDIHSVVQVWESLIKLWLWQDANSGLQPGYTTIQQPIIHTHTAAYLHWHWI